MSMLFRCPGPDLIWGIPIEWKIFPEDEVEAALENGWFNHPHKARDAVKEAPKEESEQPAAPKKRGPKPKDRSAEA